MKKTKKVRDLQPGVDSLVETVVTTRPIRELRFNGEFYTAILEDGTESQLGAGTANIEVEDGG